MDDEPAGPDAPGRLRLRVGIGAGQVVATHAGVGAAAGGGRVCLFAGAALQQAAAAVAAADRLG